MTNGEKIMKDFPNAKVEYFNPIVCVSFDDNEEHIFYRYWWNAEYVEQSPVLESNWISTSEKLPNDRDWYLGIFKEPDTGWVNPLPFICDYVGFDTVSTTNDFWILRGITDREGEGQDYYRHLKCVAWMPLPQPYDEM